MQNRVHTVLVTADHESLQSPCDRCEQPGGMTRCRVERFARLVVPATGEALLRPPAGLGPPLDVSPTYLHAVDPAVHDIGDGEPAASHQEHTETPRTCQVCRPSREIADDPSGLDTPTTSEPNVHTEPVCRMS